jgi:hypothetical protein
MIKRKVKGSIAIVASMSGTVTNQGAYTSTRLLCMAC